MWLARARWGQGAGGRLATQHVEVVCRGGDVDDLPVGLLDARLPASRLGKDVFVVVAQLEEPFKPSRRVLRALLVRRGGWHGSGIMGIQKRK